VAPVTSFRVRRWLIAVTTAAILVLAVPGPGAAAGPREITCSSQARPGGTAVELSVDGRVVIRLRAAAGGLSPGQRCDLVRERLLAALAAGTADPRPEVLSGEPVVTMGGVLLVTVPEATARVNDTVPSLLAWRWANNLREALGLGVLPLSAAPYEGLAGVQRVRASWYGWELAGRRTASGEPFAPEDLTAAHRSLPFGTRVRVIAPWSGAQVIVRINDRGPWAHGRSLDLSLAAARAIGLDRRGVADVLLEVVDVPGAR